MPEPINIFEHMPVGLLRPINPVEDRIDEALEALNKLKRLTRRPHDTQGMIRAANHLHNAVEDALDKVSDAIDLAIQRG
jgi:hypothetical protein